MNSEPMNGQGAVVPVRRSDVLVAPPGGGTTGGAGGLVLDQNTVLAAMRRRWLIATALGLTGALVGAATTWLLIPVTYTARAELRVKPASYTPGGGLPGENVRQETYRQTLGRMIEGPIVLKQVVRREEIAKLATIADQTDPLLFFEKGLRVTNPATEFLQLSLTGNEPSDLAPILNGVVEVFLKEVATREAQERTKIVNSIDAAKADTKAKLADFVKTKERLVKKLGGDNEMAVEAAKAKESLYSDIRRQAIMAKIEKTKIIAELTLREKQEKSEGKTLDDQLIDLRLDQRKEVLMAAYQVEKEREGLSRREGKGPASSVDEYARRVKDAEERLKEIREELRPQVIEDLKERTLLDDMLSKEALERKLALLDIEIDGFENQLVYEDEAKSSKLGW
ncbi:MAG: hypothetical protein ACK5EA_29620, partial [Planctomycetaceae bacterium]